jgi:hypothetical protein
MAQSQSPEKPQKTQEELREIWQQRIQDIRKQGGKMIDEYAKKVKEGEFKDKPGEEPGSGNKRDIEAQAEITQVIERGERMKNKLDSNEELPQESPDILPYLGKQYDLELSLGISVCIYFGGHERFSAALRPKLLQGGGAASSQGRASGSLPAPLHTELLPSSSPRAQGRGAFPSLHFKTGDLQPRFICHPQQRGALSHILRARLSNPHEAQLIFRICNFLRVPLHLLAFLLYGRIRLLLPLRL